MASPWPPLFSTRTTLWSTAVCDLAGLVRSHMVPQNSGLTMRRSPWGRANQGSLGLAARFTLGPVAGPPHLPQTPKATSAGEAPSFLTRLTTTAPAICVGLFQGTVAHPPAAASPELDASHHSPDANRLQSPPHLTHVSRQVQHLGTKVSQLRSASCDHLGSS